MSAELTELEDYGLIRRVGRQYGGDALAVARAVAALRQYGVQARHLRAVKAPPTGKPTWSSRWWRPSCASAARARRDAAARTAWQIADLTLRLHATLVESALAEAGLAAAPLGRADTSRGIRSPGQARVRTRRARSRGPAGRLPGDYGCTLAKGEVASRGSPGT